MVWLVPDYYWFNFLVDYLVIFAARPAIAER
jgi:hypothetical protein